MAIGKILGVPLDLSDKIYILGEIFGVDFEKMGEYGFLSEKNQKNVKNVSKKNLYFIAYIVLL